MTPADELVLAAAVYGPAAASLGWLVVSRWVAARRVLGTLLLIGAHTAAWTVLARVYRGEEVSWRGLSPSLLQATVLVVAEIAVIMALVRAERLGPSASTGLVVATGAVVTATALAAYTGSLVLLGIALPVSTLAVVAAGLTGGGLPGLAGLAAADVAALVGLSVAFADTGSVLLGEGGGRGVPLILLAAALKAGAVPWAATWRLGASDGPPAVLAAALRGQGLALAATAAFGLAGFEEHLEVAAGAAALAVAGGVSVAFARAPGAVMSALAGVGATFPLFALGLGGAVGARAFLLSFPAFLLASGAGFLVSWRPAGEPPRWSRRLGGLAAAVCAASLLGLPPGGGTPGAWLGLHLAAGRGERAPSYLLLVALVLVGVAASAVAGVTFIRSVRPRPLAASLAVAAAGFLVYMGAAPVRLGIGWWVRVERGLEAPRLLGAAGAPDLPPVPGGPLLAGALLAVAAALALVALGRGLREPEGAASPTAAVAASRLVTLLARVRTSLEGYFVGPALSALLFLATAVLAGRLVLLGAHQGFL